MDDWTTVYVEGTKYTFFPFFFTSMEGSACIMSSSTGWVETDERTVGESNVES